MIELLLVTWNSFGFAMEYGICRDRVGRLQPRIGRKLGELFVHGFPPEGSGGAQNGGELCRCVISRVYGFVSRGTR